MEKKFSAKTKWIAGIACGLVIALVAGSAAYAAHFADIALPGTTVASESVTGHTAEEIAESVTARAAHTTLNITAGDTVVRATLEDLGVTVDAEATAAAALNANKSLISRFASLFQKTNVDVVYRVDQDVFNAFVQQLSSTAGTPVTNANVVAAEDGASFTISHAVAGQGIDEDQLTAAIATAMKSLGTVDATLDITEHNPTVTDEDAQAKADIANHLITVDVTIYDQNGRAHTATAEEKASWVTVATNDDGTLADPTFDAAKVTEWVTALGASTNREATSGVRNVNSRGDVVSTITEATTGYTVNNVEQIASDMLAAINGGESYSATFTYDTTEGTYTTRVIADGAENLAYQATEGEKWIDVNLSNHTVTAYEGATIVRGPMYVVSGATLTPTVTGTYKIYLKHQTQTMTGENVDGSPYRTENVPWVSYWYSGYAFHGAPWRSSFGYAGAYGSHGCVNMTVADAKWIYDWGEIGTVVVSHY